MRWIAVFVVCATVAAAAGCAYGADSFQARPFDAPTWRTSESERGAMVDDLLRRHIRIGMSRASVRALLGPTELSGPGYDTYHVGRYKRQESDFLTLYYVGRRLQKIDRPIGVPLGDLTK